MKLKDNPSFALVHKMKSGTEFYVHTNDSEIALARFIAAQAQNIYSQSGATKEMLQALVGQMLDIVNDDKSNNKRIRSDISTLCNNILYRTKYPLDEECSLRMGAIYTIMDGEDPNKCEDSWTQKKMKLAREDRGLYDFFIQMGINATPAYRELSTASSDSGYFQRREQTLEALTPPQ